MTALTYGQQIKQRLLAEGGPKKIEDSTAGASELEKLFPVKSDQAIVSLMTSLGVPLSSLKVHRADVIESIQPMSDMFKKNAKFRTLVSRLKDAIADATQAGGTVVEQKVSSTGQSVLQKKLTREAQLSIYNLLKGLGLPESVEKVGTNVIAANIKGLAALLTKDAKFRLHLNNLCAFAGIAGCGNEMVREDITDLGADEEAAITLTRLLTVMGFDLDSTISINKQMERSVVARHVAKLSRSEGLNHLFGKTVGKIAALLYDEQTQSVQNI